MRRAHPARNPKARGASEVGLEDSASKRPRAFADVVSQRNTAVSDLERVLRNLIISMRVLNGEVVDAVLAADEAADEDFIKALLERFSLTLLFQGKCVDVDLKGEARSKWKTPDDMTDFEVSIKEALKFKTGLPQETVKELEDMVNREP